MQKIFPLLAASFLMLISHAALAQKAKAETVTVNGVRIEQTKINDWMAYAVANGAKDTPELRQTIQDNLVISELINQDVKKTGILNKPENSIKLKAAEQAAVSEIWFATYLQQHPVTDAEVRAEYDRQLALSKEPKNANQYELSQIIVGSEPDAYQLIKQLNDGANFETLAKEKSIDKATAEKGGLVGWLLPSQLAPSIADVIVNLTKGKITQMPLQTSTGWLIIKLANVRPFVMPSFDQVKDGLTQAMIQQKRQLAIAELMKNAKIAKSN